MSKKFLYFLVGLAFALGASTSALGKEFYKGKRIRIIVGASPGGGFDTYARLIARHLGKHIPGHPSVLVQNMPGGGMLIAANYTYNMAKPDGLTIGHWTGALTLQHVMGNKAAKIDGRKIGWLGAPVPANSTCVFTRASGIRSANDWFSSGKTLNMGGQGPGSSLSDTPRIIKATIDPPMKLTEGYRGTANVRLAMERGEMDGLCGWGWSSVKGTAYDKIKSGELKVVLQTTLKRHPELKDVPIAIEYAKDDKSRKLLEVDAYIHGLLERVYSVPPGVPKERLRLLQKAFIETLNDPVLLKEARKAKLQISPVDGATIAKAVNSLYGLNSELVAELKQILLGRK